MAVESSAPARRSAALGRPLRRRAGLAPASALARLQPAAAALAPGWNVEIAHRAGADDLRAVEALCACEALDGLQQLLLGGAELTAEQRLVLAECVLFNVGGLVADTDFVEACCRCFEDEAAEWEPLFVHDDLICTRKAFVVLLACRWLGRFRPKDPPLGPLLQLLEAEPEGRDPALDRTRAELLDLTEDHAPLHLLPVSSSSPPGSFEEDDGLLWFLDDPAAARPFLKDDAAPADAETRPRRRLKRSSDLGGFTPSWIRRRAADSVSSTGSSGGGSSSGSAAGSPKLDAYPAASPSASRSPLHAASFSTGRGSRAAFSTGRRASSLASFTSGSEQPRTRSSSSSLGLGLRLRRSSSLSAPRLLDFPPDQVARQLALFLQHKIFEQLSLPELNGLLQEDGGGRNLRRMIRLFDVVSAWVETEVLAQSHLSAAGRLRVLVFFVKMALACRKGACFHLMFALVCGLGQPTLSWVWDLAPARDLVAFRELQRAVSPKNNYLVYRADLSKSQPDSGWGRVPFLGVLLKDLAIHAKSLEAREAEPEPGLDRVWRVFALACDFLGGLRPRPAEAAREPQLQQLLSRSLQSIRTDPAEKFEMSTHFKQRFQRSTRERVAVFLHRKTRSTTLA